MVNSKAVSVTKPVFYGLRPNLLATQAEIERFEQFLAHLSQQEASDGCVRLSKWIRETLCDLREKKNARELSL